LAEGTWNCTSLEEPQEEEPNEQLQDAEDGPQGFDLNVVHDVNDEADDALTERNEDMLQVRVILCHEMKKVDNEDLLRQETSKKRNQRSLERLIT
jgi:hypothetical protein